MSNISNYNAEDSNNTVCNRCPRIFKWGSLVCVNELRDDGLFLTFPCRASGLDFILIHAWRNVIDRLVDNLNGKKINGLN